MEEFLLLLKCKPTEELIYVSELVKDVEYTIVKQDDYEAYRVIPTTPNGKLVVELIKDINIFIPKVGYYLSDFLLLKRKPNAKIIEYLANFTIDDLFAPYISHQRINKAVRKP